MYGVHVQVLRIVCTRLACAVGVRLRGIGFMHGLCKKEAGHDLGTIKSVSVGGTFVTDVL